MVIAEQAETPLQRLEHRLHPWATFVVMPVFALANAGVALSGTVAAGIVHPIGLGIVAGLALGKPLGITAGAWRWASRWGSRPAPGWRSGAG